MIYSFRFFWCLVYCHGRLVAGGKKGGGSHEHEAPAGSVMEPTEEHADGTHSSTWNIEAQPGATIRFSLGYTPMSPTSHAFDLPLRFSGVPRPPVHLIRKVAGQGLRPKLVMSTAIADFGDRVVSRDPARRVPFSDELEFTNAHSHGISWELDDALLDGLCLHPRCIGRAIVPRDLCLLLLRGRGRRRRRQKEAGHQERVHGRHLVADGRRVFLVGFTVSSSAELWGFVTCLVERQSVSQSVLPRPNSYYTNMRAYTGVVDADHLGPGVTVSHE